jgi:hypothetical protein
VSVVAGVVALVATLGALAAGFVFGRRGVGHLKQAAKLARETADREKVEAKKDAERELEESDREIVAAAADSSLGDYLDRRGE